MLGLRTLQDAPGKVSNGQFHEVPAFGKQTLTRWQLLANSYTVFLAGRILSEISDPADSKEDDGQSGPTCFTYSR